MLIAYAGTENERCGEARDEILAQLDAIARGEITDEELASAKADVRSALRGALDSPGELEGFYLSAAVSGAEYSPEELSELVEEVTKEKLAEIARSCECDMIYTLAGDGSAEDGGEEEETAEPSEEELKAFEEEENGDPDETV